MYGFHNDYHNQAWMCNQYVMNQFVVLLKVYKLSEECKHDVLMWKFFKALMAQLRNISHRRTQLLDLIQVLFMDLRVGAAL